MRYGKVIAALIVAGLVIGAVYMTMSADVLKVRTADADYEASFTLHYTDGSSATVKRYASMSVSYQNKTVSKISFSLDVKFKTPTEEVRLLTPRTDRDHDTEVTLYAIDPTVGAGKIISYPVSAKTQTDFSILETGGWYKVFENIDVTTSEITTALGYGISSTFTIKAVVDVWFNKDPTEDEAIHHQLEFAVPFTISKFSPVDPDDPDDDDDDDDARYDPDNRRYDLIVDPITPGNPQLPIVTVNEAVKLTNSPWIVYGDQQLTGDQYKNLGKR